MAIAGSDLIYISYPLNHLKSNKYADSVICLDFKHINKEYRNWFNLTDARESPQEA